MLIYSGRSPVMPFPLSVPSTDSYHKAMNKVGGTTQADATLGASELSTSLDAEATTTTVTGASPAAPPPAPSPPAQDVSVTSFAANPEGAFDLPAFADHYIKECICIIAHCHE